MLHITKLSDLEHEWTKNTSVRFREFLKGLRAPNWTIPADFVMEKYLDGSNGKRNPLERFLRPKTASEIFAMSSTIHAPRNKEAMVKILDEYFKNWERLFVALERFSENDSHVNAAHSCFNCLRAGCGSFRSVGKDGCILIDEPETYKRLFRDFCVAFSKIPVKRPGIAIRKSTRQTVATVFYRLNKSNGIPSTTPSPVKQGRPRKSQLYHDIAWAAECYYEKRLKDNDIQFSMSNKCHLRLIKEFYCNKTLWKSHQWMDRHGHRKEFGPRPGESTSQKAINRLNIAAITERKLRENNPLNHPLRAIQKQPVR